MSEVATQLLAVMLMRQLPIFTFFFLYIFTSAWGVQMSFLIVLWSGLEGHISDEELLFLLMSSS